MARHRKRKGLPIHGWLCLDKPLELTSTRAVSKVRRLFNAQKIGHAGTLDPMASGLLAIAFGHATKTVPWAMEGDKTYEFTIEWGTSTDSYDAEGEVIARSDKRPSEAEILKILPDFVGEIDQIPPRFSAIKIEGQRAYDLARNGMEFELTSRRVTCMQAELIAVLDEGGAAQFRIQTGKGFYVRALARDLAQRLGAHGHIRVLRRTVLGPFSEAEAISLSALEQAAEAGEDLHSFLRPIACVLVDMPKLEVLPQDKAQLLMGQPVHLLPYIVEDWRSQKEALGCPDARQVLAMTGGEAVAMGEVRAGRLYPKKVFSGSDTL